MDQSPPKDYVLLAVPCPLGFMLFVILAMIMKYIYLSICHISFQNQKTYIMFETLDILISFIGFEF